VRQPKPGQQEAAQATHRSKLLESYANIDSFGREFKNVVHGHEQTDHMSFNDDENYKALMNEVILVNKSS
jgi:hypothetical protein